MSQVNENSKSWWFKTFYLNIFMTLTNYLLPTITLCILSFLLVKSLKTANKRRNEMLSVTHSKSENKGITKSLVAVIIIFILCQLPHPVLRLLMEIFHLGKPGECNSVVFYFLPFVFIMPMLSSSVNFLVYIVFSKTFLKKLKSNVKQEMNQAHSDFTDISTIQIDCSTEIGSK